MCHRTSTGLYKNLVLRDLYILCKELYLLQTFEADLAAPEDERRDVVRRAVKRDVDAKRHIHFGVLHSTAGQSHAKSLRRGRNVAFRGHVQARSVQSLLVGYVDTNGVRQLRNQTQALAALKLQNIPVSAQNCDCEMKVKSDGHERYKISLQNMNQRAQKVHLGVYL